MTVACATCGADAVYAWPDSGAERWTPVCPTHLRSERHVLSFYIRIAEPTTPLSYILTLPKYRIYLAYAVDAWAARP